MRHKIFFFVVIIAVFTISLSLPAFAICDDCLASHEWIDWGDHCDSLCVCVWEQCHSCGDSDTMLSFYCSETHNTCPDCAECLNCSVCVCEDENHVCYFREVDRDEATCTSPGTIYKECECGESYTESIPATGHDWSDTLTDLPTCYDRGRNYKICYNCNNVKVQSFIPAAHNYILDKLVTPTCFAAGYKIEKCSSCGGEIRTDWGPLEHSMNGKEWVPPTCTKGGYYEDICNEGCGYVEITGQTDPLGHDHKQVVTAPTCTTQGYTLFTCTRLGCNDTYTSDYTEPTGHINLTSTVTASTCSTSGVKVNSCTDCGTEVSREPLPLAAHQFSNGTCVACSAKDPSYIPPCNHQYSVVSDVPATCLSVGLRSEKCDFCGDIKNTETPKKEHVVAGTDVTLPTCTTEGFTKYTCTYNCGYNYISDRKPVLGHNYSALITPPTCENSGYTLYTCDRADCGASYKDNFTNPTGHVNVGTTEIKPTCDSDGSRVLACTECGKEVSSTVLPAFGHQYVDGVCSACGCSTACQHVYSEVVIPPTCSDEGYSIFTCDKCGDFYTGNVINMRSHVWKEISVVQPSCEVNGSTNFTCNYDGCGATKTEVITALSHDWNSVATDFGENGEAVVTMECSICKKQKTQIVPSASAQAQNWLLTVIRGFFDGLTDFYDTIANGIQIGGVTLGEVVTAALIVCVILVVIGLAIKIVG